MQFRVQVVMTSIEQCRRHQTEPDSLTSICLEISHLMDDSSANINNFTSAIRFNPELSSIILKIANNAYAGFSGEIKSLSQAVKMIGIGQLHYIINSIHDSPELRTKLNQMSEKIYTVDELSQDMKAG